MRNCGVNGYIFTVNHLKPSYTPGRTLDFFLVTPRYAQISPVSSASGCYLSFPF